MWRRVDGEALETVGKGLSFPGDLFDRVAH